MAELTEKDLEKEARSLIDSLTVKKCAAVIALYGDLGAGKTTLTKAIAHTLGVEETVTSPTFVIEKIYRLDPKKTTQHFARLIHIDAYRLENSHELMELGWEDIVRDPENLIVIEWAGKVEDILPESAQKIDLKVVTEEVRTIAYRE
ncbi:MAG: tRNA (adenosine(37)-N6)-threonylcarbamoyltransferase complex ATPase subunit type 1 TsaE [Candidatus Pacebacteria bacterium]|nr:tRNA (adenosine(37)-N6)-threonylcarbamoyltransferase complex ATPase subunit type 1 TsaE [Candidatus Paceibacterota bacterium]